MEASAAAEQLGEVAVPERTGDRAASRLRELRAVFAADLAQLEAELARAAADGPAPASQAAGHLLAAGGKRVRPLCVMLAAACFGRVTGVTRELAVVAELIHLATLLHDDVIDDADLRRGAVAARRVWGNAVSVLAGDLLLTHALDRTARVAPGPTMTDLLSTLRALVDGEIIQLRGRTSADATEATYLGIIEGKTASLFAWAARAGARSASADEASVAKLGSVGRDIGMAFQLVDDALDYAGDAGKTGKRLLADLGEGKVTLPLLVAMRARPEVAGLAPAARNGDEAAARAILAAISDSRGADVARARAAEHTRAALAALETLPPTFARDLLAALATELTTRAD